MDTRIRPSYRFAIVGAGLAGLSLARAFARRGVTDPIVILDAKPAFLDDRTWSFWDVDAGDDTHLASGSWNRWELRDDSGAYMQQSAGAPYVSIKSRDFYAAAQTHISDSGYDLLLGRAVTSIVESAGSCVISTRDRTIVADYVFDARGLSGEMLGRSAVVQRFAGRRVVVDFDAFDATTATLMDVQRDTDDGFHFFYVLPFGPREALIENTYFARRPLSRARLDYELDAYITRRIGTAQPASGYREVGSIPMSSGLTLPKRTARVIPIGLRGGCARPGSGYTFHRVQAQTACIADAFASTANVPSTQSFGSVAPACDAFLIEAARRAPKLLPRAFRRLFATIEGDRLANFMMDRAGPLETLPVLVASVLGALEGLGDVAPVGTTRVGNLAAR